jgi:arginine-tRNA-protein transferase
MDPIGRELLRFRTPPRSCSYLPEESASLEYRIHDGMTADAFYELLRRGWRRHGMHLFRPRCPACTQCRGLRVLAEEFHPSRSQRRTIRRNAGVRVVLQPPSVTAAHVRLYNDYHVDLSRRRGWPSRRISPDEYEQSFVAGCFPFAREMLYFDDDRLIGVGLVDLLPQALSSVYFFHDPAWRPLGPGTYSLLKELEFCRETSRPYNYLGYWIAPCQSMAYKANFHPHETLDRIVDPPEEPSWRRAARALAGD